MKDANEESWVLVGQRRACVWFARRMRYRKGQPASVNADGKWALAREEKRGDVVGFLHTHPMGGTRPSSRDVRTMRAWCDAFGKSLICLIATPDALVGYRFDDHRSSGEALSATEKFGNVFIGVDHGGKIPSRAALPRRGNHREARGAADHIVRRGRRRIESR